MYSFLHQTIAFALRTSGKTHHLNPNSGENGHLKKVEMSSGFERWILSVVQIQNFDKHNKQIH